MSGPGLKDRTTERQYEVLAKNAVATYVCTEEGEPCEDCDPYCGEEVRLPEAEELIPQHPNCQCWYEWDWDPSLRELPMAALLTRASNPSPPMHDTLTKTTSTTDASIVKGTPTSEDDETEYLKVPISSTNADRDGDRFSEDGLEDLRDQIRETSKPVFENHGIGEGGLLGVRYDWKGIIGSQDDAEIAEDGDVKTLYSYIKPNERSEEGELFRSYVEAGMPVGLSIGFRPLDYESNDDDENVFHETDLLETSAVGIQSNQESVAGRDAPTVEAVAKGVAARFDADLDEDTLAKAIVSEASAAASGPLLRGADGRPADYQPLRDPDHDHELRDHEPDKTHQDSKMDDDTKELMERLTAIQENEQEKRIELEQRVADLEPDGSEGDPEGGKYADPDGDGPTGDEVAELRSEVEELRDTLDNGDGAEDSETTTAKELDDEEKDADGEEKEVDEPAGEEVVM